MSPKTLPRHEITLMLDDIREERGGKFSLIGLYTQDIIVEALPAMMSKLCLFTRMKGGEGTFSVKFSIKDPNGDELLSRFTPFNMTAREGYSHVNFMVSPFGINHEGRYDLKMYLDDELFYEMSFFVKKAKVLN
ncbi:MAG: hypothetical protein K8I01_13120 [Candidatus Methylomirabilis sp.]|nr:hypothetical protein [Deltaproteobacteria bacterium]